MEERSAANFTQEAHRQVMHDLRTPLTVLLGRVQLLRRDRVRGLHPERLDGDLEAIEAAVLRLAAAVEQVEESGPPALSRIATNATCCGCPRLLASVRPGPDHAH